MDLSNRSRSFIIYGATEKVGNKPMKPDAVLQDVFLDLNNQSLSMSNPQVTAVRRIGTPKSDLENAARPIKVTLTNPEEVKVVLSKSNLLKISPDAYFRKLYLAPDRTYEQRTEHRKLVSEMKRRIDTEPNKYHYIKDKRTIIGVEKRLSENVEPLKKD